MSSNDKTLKLVTNLDRAAIEARLAEVRKTAEAAGLGDRDLRAVARADTARAHAARAAADGEEVEVVLHVASL